MSNEIILFTQVASIVIYISAIFIIYRIYVSQKDATIELLKERINDLKEKIIESDSHNSDNISEMLAKRIRIYESELDRLKKDQSNDKEYVNKIEDKLRVTREESVKLETINKKVEGIQNEIESLRCEVNIDDDYLKNIYGYLDNEIMDHLHKTKQAYTIDELSGVLNVDPFLIKFRLNELCINGRVNKITEDPDTIRFKMILRS